MDVKTHNGPKASLNAKCKTLAGLREILDETHGVATVNHYVDEKTSAELDAVITEMTLNVKTILKKYPKIYIPYDTFALNFPMPHPPYARITILQRGGHFEIGRYTPDREVKPNRIKLRYIPKACLEIDETLNGEIYSYALYPSVKGQSNYEDTFSLEDDELKEEYKQLINELIETIQKSFEKEQSIVTKNARLLKLQTASQAQLFLDYLPGTRPQDEFGTAIHCDPSASVYMSLQTSPKATTWFVGILKSFLAKMVQCAGSLTIINNKIDKTHSDHPEGNGVGPYHDFRAPLNGRRSVIYEFIRQLFVEEVFEEALDIDLNECLPPRDTATPNETMLTPVTLEIALENLV